jgi:hypothetical protein
MKKFSILYVMALFITGCPEDSTTITDLQEVSEDGDIQIDTATDLEETTGITCKSDKECENIAVGSCRKAVCNYKTNECVSVPDDSKESTSCVPQNKCAIGDGKCKQGSCVPSLVKKCEDEIACTEDSCDPGTGDCVFTKLNGAGCDDSDSCTENDKCVEGTCQPGKNICQCKKVEDCPAIENKCLGEYECKDNKCVIKAGTAISCEQSSEPCKVNLCDPSDGICKLNNREDNTGCSDNKKCTENDLCINGNCEGKEIKCDDKNECTLDSCDENTGKCTTQNLIDTKCDDKDICTDGETCKDGNCGNGTMIFGCCHDEEDCDDDLSCTKETCANNKCSYELQKCDPTGAKCGPKLCLTDSCEVVAVSKLTGLKGFYFDKEIPAGIKTDPVNGFEISGGAIKLKQGIASGFIYFPPAVTLDTITYLWVKKTGTGKITVYQNDVAGDFEKTAGNNLYVPVASPIIKIKIEGDAGIVNAGFVGFGKKECGDQDMEIDGENVIDSGIASNPDGLMLAGWLFKKDTKYRFAVRGFSPDGKDLGSVQEVNEDYTEFSSYFRISITWLTDRFFIAYGGVMIGGNLKTKLLEYKAGEIVKNTTVSGTSDSQYEPCFAVHGSTLLTCYSSSTIDGQGLGIACRKADGSWVAMNENNYKDQFSPDAAFYNTGKSIVVWANDEGGIRGKIEGNIEMEIYKQTGKIFTKPRVAVLDNNALVVLEGTGIAGNEGYGIFAILLKNTTPETTLLDLTVTKEGDQKNPAVITGDNGFIVLYSDLKTEKVFAVYLDKNGSVQGSFILNASGSLPHVSHIFDYIHGVLFTGSSKTLLYDLIGTGCPDGWYDDQKICIGHGYY